MKKLPDDFWESVIDRAIQSLLIGMIGIMVLALILVIISMPGGLTLVIGVIGAFGIIVGIATAIEYWRLPK